MTFFDRFVSRGVGPLVLALPFTLTLAVTIASCVSLFDLQDHQSAVEMLCKSVADCDDGFYPKCVAEAEARLDNATPEEREAFLTAFADTGCLETCSSAKSCLDLDPICADAASSCEVEAQCCGFWNAGTACLEGACCKPDGVTCTSGADCCSGECIESEGEMTCGGVQCSLLGEACGGNGLSCCGNADFRCSIATQTCVRCEEMNSPCEASADCCSNYCDNEESGESTGICTDPSCGVLTGGTCFEDDECCSGLCVFNPTVGAGVCNTQNCLPVGQSCTGMNNLCCSGRCRGGLCVDDDCLPANSLCEIDTDCCFGICDEDTETCCLAPSSPCAPGDSCCGETECQLDMNGSSGYTCQGNTACKPSGTCNTNSECCSQHCSTYDMCCTAVQMPCSHPVCKVGDPLQPSCSDSAGMTGDGEQPFGPPGCITTICDMDGLGYCCCEDWDDACVAAVEQACGVACGVGTFP